MVGDQSELHRLGVAPTCSKLLKESRLPVGGPCRSGSPALDGQRWENPGNEDSLLGIQGPCLIASLNSHTFAYDP